MNSSLSLHRVALDLLIGAPLSVASNPNIFLEDSFPVVDLRNRDCEVRGRRIGLTRRSGHFPQGRLTCAHPVLSNRVVLLPRCQLIGSWMVRG